MITSGRGAGVPLHYVGINTDKRMLSVEWLEARRFLVKSLSNPSNIHLVDMEEYDGFGECSCERWHFNVGPKLKKGKRPASSCRHIRAVRHRLKEIDSRAREE